MQARVARMALRVVVQRRAVLRPRVTGRRRKGEHRPRREQVPALPPRPSRRPMVNPYRRLLVRALAVPRRAAPVRSPVAMARVLGVTDRVPLVREHVGTVPPGVVTDQERAAMDLRRVGTVRERVDTDPVRAGMVRERADMVLRAAATVQEPEVMVLRVEDMVREPVATAPRAVGTVRQRAVTDLQVADTDPGRAVTAPITDRNRIRARGGGSTR